jgi:hypothetical protein
MNEGNNVPSNAQFGGANSTQQPQNASTGMNVEEFLSDVEKVNQESFKSNRKKVDLKEATYNPKPGKVPEGEEIRVVPPIEGKAFQKIDFHWNIGASKMVVCPRQYDRECPICEHLETQPDGDDKKKKEAKTRYFLPIVVRQRESEGPKWWGFPKTILNVIAGLAKNKYYGDIADIYTGNDLQIEFPSDADTASIMPAPMKSALMVDENGQSDEEKINTLRGLVKPLNEVFIELPYDAIKKILDKSLGLNQENNENNGQNTGTGMSGLNNN